MIDFNSNYSGIKIGFASFIIFALGFLGLYFEIKIIGIPLVSIGAIGFLLGLIIHIKKSLDYIDS